MANKLIIEVNAAKPEEPKRRLPRGWILTAVGALSLAAAGGYALHRAGLPAAVPALVAQVDPVGEAAPPVTGAVAVAAAPTNPPMAVIAPLPAGTIRAVAAEPEPPRPGAVRVTVTAPEYAAAFLAGTGKRLQLDTNSWESVPAFPHTLAPVSAGSRLIRVEAEGFDCASLQGTNGADVLVEGGVTNEIAFTLTPRPATLTVACNATNAVVRIWDRESGVGSSVSVPSLASLEIHVSAAGYVAQALTLSAIKPGGRFRQEVTLEPEPKAAAADSGAGRKAGETQTVDLGWGVKMELVWCPPGEFMMGSPESETGRQNGETQHRVTLTKGLWLGKAEVTRRQWGAVMGSSPPFEDSVLPVKGVSWDDCQEFFGKLNTARRDARPAGGEFRLPTEAEWEYACRAGATGPYAGELDELGWWSSNSGNLVHAVGQKRPNAWGLSDMHGNKWELCHDWYGDYPSGSVTDPEGAASGSNRVLRGGSWDDIASHCRSAGRSGISPSHRSDSFGFRAARTLP